jgi:hypothetical protein
MPFDNTAFTAWLQQFTATLVEYGLTEPQSLAVREKRYTALAGAFAAGQSAEDMAFMERIRGMDP